MKRFILTALLMVSTASAAFGQTLTDDTKKTRFSFANSIDSAAAETARVGSRQSDSLLNGALIGAGVAIGGGLFLCTSMEPWSTCRDDIAPMLKIGVLGAGIGIAIDTLIRDGKTPRADARARVAPIVSRRAKGVQMSFSF